LWFMKVAIGIGDFLFIGFGACVLLYFPQQLPAGHAGYLVVYFCMR
jgi:hypothetical protein